MTPHRLRILLWLVAAAVVGGTGTAWWWHFQNPPEIAEFETPATGNVSDSNSEPTKPNDAPNFEVLTSMRLQQSLYDAPPPEKTTAKQPAKRVPPKPQLAVTLRGTIRTSDGFKALLLTPANAVELLAVGQHLASPHNDVVVDDVQQNSVTLKRGPHTYSFSVAKGKK